MHRLCLDKSHEMLGEDEQFGPCQSTYQTSVDTHFLIVIEDYLSIAEQLQAANKDQKGALQVEPRRTASRAQEPTGERADEGEKGVSYVMVTRDG